MPAKKATDRLLDAISSLKRAAFIENLQVGGDHWKNGQCVIYTESQHSSDILTNLLSQAFSATEPSQSGKRTGKRLPHLEQMEHDYEIFEIRFPAAEKSCQLLAEQVEKLAQQLIAPDQTRRR